MEIDKKISVIEDNPDLREALSMIIQFTNGLTLAGSYPNAEVALFELENNIPDAILVDINLPGDDGITFVSSCKKKYPKVLCLMCTSYEDDEKIFKSLEVGASGYILKTDGLTKIIEGVKDLFEGGSPMTGSIARKVVASFSRIDYSNQSMQSLTNKEMEILAWLSKGLLNKEVAFQLNISIGTVKKHIQNIYEKLHVNTRVEAVNKYLKR
jgi:NarL family two-component system response regulator LiaR